MVTLQTPRLLLRMFRQTDIDAYARICADPDVMRFLGGTPMSRGEAWRQMAMFLGHWQLRGYGMWAVEERETGTLVGRVGFLEPEGWPGFELAWTLGRPHWGRGFASEAARAALDYAFTTLGRERVISLIHPDNPRSIRVAERLGEHVEGEAEVNGWHLRVYAIRKEAWRAR